MKQSKTTTSAIHFTWDSFRTWWCTFGNQNCVVTKPLSIHLGSSLYPHKECLAFSFCWKLRDWCSALSHSGGIPSTNCVSTLQCATW